MLGELVMLGAPRLTVEHLNRMLTIAASTANEWERRSLLLGLAPVR